MNHPVPVAAIGAYMAGLALIVGLIARRRWRLSLCLLAYNVTGVISAPLPVFWPERFYTRPFWMLAQAVLDILKLGIALEIAWQTFRVFPGAASVARRTVLTILAVTTAAVISVPLAGAATSSFDTALSEFHPRVIDGTIWLIAATLVLARWYRVPVHPFHAAVLTSLAVYLAFFGTLLRSFALYDFDTVFAYANALDSVALLALVCSWAYVTWRPESTGAKGHVETLGKLELRTASLRVAAPTRSELFGSGR
jgi:hypothetical protein